MLAHLLKLAWNRKRANVLIMLEILAAFLVVFFVVASALYTFRYYTRPCGYDYRDVWSVEIIPSESHHYGGWTVDEVAMAHRLADEVKLMGPVEAVALASNRPYSNTTSLTRWKFQGRDVEAEVISASDDYAKVLSFELLEGRWFDPDDAALGWEPVVVNPELAGALFGDDDPVGRRMRDEGSEQDLRVVGVLRAWRRGGELEAPRPAYFTRAGDRDDRGTEARFMVIRVAPGTPADFEEPLTERLHAVAPEWSYTVKTLAADREGQLQSEILPLTLGATVGGFLLVMVVLGLTGVMWQNVTRRTREIGVRRAMGASMSDVHRQIVTEVMMTAAFGLFVGVLIVIQIPLVAPSLGLSYAVVLTALAIAALLTILLAGACGLYPGWTATRVEPAEALHYE
jgi:putative ABC transport system permease protein